MSTAIPVTAPAMTPLAPPVAPAVAWTARPIEPSDRAAVLDLFTDPDFHFRTTAPHLLAESEVDALIGPGTRLLLADGEPAGLYALTRIGNAHGCHYRLHLRLTSWTPLDRWVSAYREILAALRWRSEVIRLSVTVAETDELGRAAAAAIGLTHDGTLTGVASGVVFAQTWREHS